MRRPWLRAAALLAAGPLWAWLGAAPGFAAAPTLASVQAQLRANQVVRGDFRQVRELKALSRPLASSGKFLLVRGRGLLWRQTQPFPLRMSVSETVLRTESPGAAPVEVRAEDNPLVFTVSRLFLALFTGDEAQLSAAFAVTFQALDGERWRLLLHPADPLLEASLAEVRLEGAVQISALEVQERSGDRTRIVFSNVRFTPEALSDEEERAFRP